MLMDSCCPMQQKAPESTGCQGLELAMCCHAPYFAVLIITIIRNCRAILLQCDLQWPSTIPMPYLLTEQPCSIRFYLQKMTIRKHAFWPAITTPSSARKRFDEPVTELPHAPIILGDPPRFMCLVARCQCNMHSANACHVSATTGCENAGVL